MGHELCAQKSPLALFQNIIFKNVLSTQTTSDGQVVKEPCSQIVGYMGSNPAMIRQIGYSKNLGCLLVTQDNK